MIAIFSLESYFYTILRTDDKRFFVIQIVPSPLLTEKCTVVSDSHSVAFVVKKLC